MPYKKRALLSSEKDK